jgi:hypothetical protein
LPLLLWCHAEACWRNIALLGWSRYLGHTRNDRHLIRPARHSNVMGARVARHPYPLLRRSVGLCCPPRLRCPANLKDSDSVASALHLRPSTSETPIEFSIQGFATKFHATTSSRWITAQVPPAPLARLRRPRDGLLRGDTACVGIPPLPRTRKPVVEVLIPQPVPSRTFSATAVG